MSVELNHTIVPARDKHASAQFLADLLDAGVDTWADPDHNEPGEINTRWGGRGIYFPDPDGHNMEILTRRPTDAS